MLILFRSDTLEKKAFSQMYTSMVACTIVQAGIGIINTKIRKKYLLPEDSIMMRETF
jgi:hypothetical protein